MNLSAGARLGPYEVLSPLGAGGMGEVWKARDTRLNRIVAIKSSKTEFSERFEREAHAIAALNHLYVYRPGELPAKVYRLNLATGRKQLWKELMPPDPAGVYFIRPPHFSQDGNAYAYSYARLLSDLYVMDGVQ